MRRAVRGLRYAVELWRLSRRLRAEPPDVVVFGEVRFAIDRMAVRRVKRAGAVVVDIVHDVRPFDTTRGSERVLRDDFRRWGTTYQLFDVLFVHGERNRDLFLQTYPVPSERVVAIPHGVDEVKLEVPSPVSVEELRVQLGIEPGQPVLLFFGTIAKYKGVEDLLRALPEIVATSGARLVVAGYPAKDTDPEALRELAAELDVADDIAWMLDYVPNELVGTLMLTADVVVLPYRAISDSGVLKVAMSFGRAVVATDVGGIPDVIEDGVTGLLVEPGDQGALVDACVRALTEDGLARSLGSNAEAELQRRFGWDVVTGRFFDAVTSAGAGAGPR
jgi:glycosyltransferase involved in cell wall biosynthesis